MMTPYEQRADAAMTQRKLPVSILERLRTDGAYWQGFHDARPHADLEHGTSILEDPIRPGRWCVIRPGGWCVADRR